MPMQKLLGLALVLGWSANAQQVQVRGKVVDGTGKAIANAIAEIVKLKAKDTTGTDGAFSIPAPVTGLLGTTSTRAGSVDFSKGILNLALSRPLPVSVAIYDAQGNVLFQEAVREKMAGNYRLDLRGNLPANQLSIVRATLGEETRSFPFLPMSFEGDPNISIVAANPGSTGLAKVAATIDSLKIAAAGFTSLTLPLSSYDTTVQVTLAASTGKTSPGCGAASPLKTGNFTESINGVNRKWMLEVPANYDGSKPYRLIFVWHPLGGTGSQVVSGGFNGLKTLANGSAIFATADGLQGSNSETSGTGWWNANGGDMKLVQAMLDKINGGLCVDQERIFSTGFSFGGMMSYTLPFEFDVFRAVAPCSGKVGVIDYVTKFTRPIPIMAFHGNSDTFVTTALGKQFFDRYATRNTCGTQTKAVTPTGCVQYEGCAAQSIWCLFNGGHNTWSEEPAAIWKFFSQF
jgi:poly(3-hydroxybutyrate) depolymerase